MKFTLTRKVEVQQEVVEKIAEEFINFLQEEGVLRIPNADPRSNLDLVKDWIEERNKIVR